VASAPPGREAFGVTDCRHASATAARGMGGDGSG
jgi:hypothetical protein